MRTLIMMLVVVAAVLCLASASTARVWQVKKDGSGDYTVIQDAVDNAASGDTVQIGPGRYTEYRAVDPTAKWPYDAYVEVTIPVLTLIGSGTSQTFIGPEVRDPAAELPIGVCALLDVTGVTISDLAIESMESGVYRSEGGSTHIQRSAFRACDKAVLSWGDGGTIIEDCTFKDSGYGISTFPPAKDLTVQRCSFTECEVGTDFNTTSNAMITDCTYTGGMLGIQFALGTQGTVRRSRLSGMNNYSIVATSSSIMSIQQCQLHGGWTRLRATNFSTLTCLATVISAGSSSTVDVAGSSVIVNGCHVLHGTGPSVRVAAFVSPPIVTLDFTGNYWGTDSADSLASWIIDHNDVPAVNAIVDFEPFSATPLPAEQKSLGSAKNLYR